MQMILQTSNLVKLPTFWIAVVVTLITVIGLWSWKKELINHWIDSLMKSVRQFSPLFWCILFLMATVLIWTNGGALSLTSQTLTWKTVTALIFVEISVGFLVAWILIQFVDKPAKEDAANDFSQKQAVLSQNIFQYLYGVELPDELFKQIEKNILKTPIYRRNYVATYNFLKEIGDKFLIKVDIQCDVYNITDSPQEYSVTGGIERPHTDDTGITQELGLSEMFINNIAVGVDEIEAAQKAIKDTSEEFTFKHDVTIPPRGHINVKLTLWMTKWKRDYEIFRVLESSDSVKMNLIFPKPLSIKCSVIHPNKKFSHRHESENSLTVEMDYPLAPQNGILLWWGDTPAKKVKKKPAKVE